MTKRQIFKSLSNVAEYVTIGSLDDRNINKIIQVIEDDGPQSIIEDILNGKWSNESNRQAVSDCFKKPKREPSRRRVSSHEFDKLIIAARFGQLGEVQVLLVNIQNGDYEAAEETLARMVGISN